MEIQEEDKALDSTSALEKVLRLDKKHTNFDFHDPIRGVVIKVTYPQLQPEGPSSEALLKSLWRHACNYYFKPIEDGELKRLHYLKDVLSGHCQGVQRFEQGEDYWRLVDSLFSDQFMRKYLKGEEEALELRNSLEMIHIVWQGNQMKESKGVGIKRRCQQVEVLRAELARVYSGEGGYRQKLIGEGRRLRDKIIKPSKKTELDDQIQQLQLELKETVQEVEPMLDKLQKGVKIEASTQEIIFCSNSRNDLIPDLLSESSRIERRLAKLKSLETLNGYIEYTVRQLERRQIAQSITKILRVEKSKGETRLVLSFEQGMGLKPITVSEKEFKSLNDLREYSLLKFYNTASKSRYTFICQNYLGFKDMYQHRNKPCSLKDKNIFHEMKVQAPDPQNAPYLRQFNAMEICHHCKLLQPKSALVKCEYRSTRCGSPIPPSPFYDSYLNQIVRSQYGSYPDEQARVNTMRFLNGTPSRKNSYFHYNKEGDDYVCGRYYCRYCLKNYEEGRDKNNGLCPYCRNICYCTRCSRNQTMIRLKSMFVLMGGDIHQLQRQGLFEGYYAQPEEAIALRQKEKSKGKRGNSVPGRMGEKMLSIRYQLQDLRIICDLVKRREKNKQKLDGCMREVFRKEVELLWEGFKMAPRPKPSVQKDGLSQKLAKKLKRMIA